MAIETHRRWRHPWQRLLAHLGFWTAYLALTLTTLSTVANSAGWVYLRQFLALPINVAVVYLTLWVIIPKVLLRKQLVLFMVLLGALLCASALLQRWLLYETLYRFLPNLSMELWDLGAIMGELLRLLLLVALAGFLKLLRTWYLERLYAERMSEEKTKAELAHLRSQVHPHFLFNTLNNIYSQSLQGGRAASESILQLSNFLRQIVYESDEKLRALDREMDLVHSYIELEKLRFGDRLTLEVNIAPEASAVQLPPLLLLPLVENAFKHGLSQVQGDVKLCMEARLQDGEFYFCLRNTATDQPKEPQQGGVGGQGQANVRDRLALHFAKRASFTTQREAGAYASEIRILGL